MSEPWTPGEWEIRDGYAGLKDVFAFDPVYRVAGAVAEADARLIALAPEMAELLRDFTSESGTAGYPSTSYATWLEALGERAADLLARARGEA